MKRYNPTEIEGKWQQIWSDTKLYEVTEDSSRESVYATPMLPYPSGSGLHVGHVRNYSISDVVARFNRQKGLNTMANIGWDAFGLPAENYAIKTGTHPKVTTKKNIATFKNQLQKLGMSFDWSREINTTDPSYYKWTQWIFTKLLEHDLAYQKESLQWWCTKCQTVLANEQVVNGKCWRHDDSTDPDVERKKTRQWFFKITDYADELLDSTDALQWPEHIKTMQKNWIGRSQGAEITFAIDDHDLEITVYTTAHETIFGTTFLVLSPEHALVNEITTPAQKSEVQKYIEAANKKTDIQRQENKEKTGVFTGSYAVNPINKEKIPIWIADYVLADYGSGAIMAVPGEDERDNEFASKYNLPIIYTTDKNEFTNYQKEIKQNKSAFTLANSGKYDGMDFESGRTAMLSDLEYDGAAVAKTEYKLRDWLISRQRYWGTPIPVVHCDKCNAVAVPEDQLPVVLPEVENYAPTGGATSVLASVTDWVNTTCPKCGGSAKRETDTMDGYACSSWYMFRYCDPNNEEVAWDPSKVNYWMPTNYYFGGDHAVSHLLYFRFWTKFFNKLKLVDFKEPVQKLIYNGYINAADGAKMSKSKDNVVDPLEIINSGYGADALRLFELFIAPYDQDTVWNTNGVPGTYRFLNRVWDMCQEFIVESQKQDQTVENQPEFETALVREMHKMVKSVTNDLERQSFNTAVARLMEANKTMREINKSLPFAAAKAIWRDILLAQLQLLAPFTPHISEELWSELGQKQSIHTTLWPTFDESMTTEDLKTVVMQINGKVRAEIVVEAGSDQATVEAAIKADEKAVKYLEGVEIKKAIYIQDRLINFVVIPA